MFSSLKKKKKLTPIKFEEICITFPCVYVCMFVGASGVSLEPLIITLAMLGKFGITGAYSTVYLMSAEIFPTAVR